MSVRVIVCGGRRYRDARHVFDMLDEIDSCLGPLEVIEGGAAGADLLAAEWAVARGRPRQTVKAQWLEHGTAAGPMRNKAMLAMAPHYVIAFPGGRGTEDMVSRAERARVPVIRC